MCRKSKDDLIALKVLRKEWVDRGVPELVDFVEKNEHLTFDVVMRRNHHPYMSCTYINGFVKDVPFRNKSKEEIQHHLTQVNSQWGRAPLRHNWNKVWGGNKSIQGKWMNDDKWNNYPKHLLEVKHETPEF